MRQTCEVNHVYTFHMSLFNGQVDQRASVVRMGQSYVNIKCSVYIIRNEKIIFPVSDFHITVIKPYLLKRTVVTMEMCLKYACLF